jgi:hypothetical protein
MGIEDKLRWLVGAESKGNRYLSDKEIRTKRTESSRSAAYNDDEVENSDRRKLGMMIAGGAATFVAATLESKLGVAKKVSKVFSRNEKASSTVENKEALLTHTNDVIEESVATAEKMEIDQETAQSFADKFKYNERVKLDKEALAGFKLDWEDKYRNKNGKYYSGLKTGYYRMGQYMKAVKHEFAKVFDNDFAAKYGEIDRIFGENLVYLALVESHWNPNAVSGAGAVGAYQLMPDTAREMGLRVDNKVDERRNPVRSAEAAAKYLKRWYAITKDWDLALMKYNGGFVGRYINSLDDHNKKYPNEKKGASLDEFLALESLGIEAKRQGVLKDTTIPELGKQKAYEKSLKHEAENFPYSAKVRAFISLIDQGLVTELAKPLAFHGKKLKHVEKRHKKKHTRV